MGYFGHSAYSLAIEAIHAAELAIPIAGGTATFVYWETSVRHGTTAWAMGDGAVLGEEGAVARAGHLASKAGYPGLVVFGGLAAASAIDAWNANAGCQ